MTIIEIVALSLVFATVLIFLAAQAMRLSWRRADRKGDELIALRTRRLVEAERDLQRLRREIGG